LSDEGKRIPFPREKQKKGPAGASLGEGGRPIVGNKLGIRVAMPQPGGEVRLAEKEGEEKDNCTDRMRGGEERRSTIYLKTEFRNV